MGKKDPPDVEDAARAEAEANRDIARQATYADRPDQFNSSLGNLTWDTVESVDPATGEKVTKWAQTQEYAPEMQKLFDQRMANEQQSLGLTNQAGMMAGTALDKAQGDLAQDMDWGQYGDVIDFNFDGDAMRQQATDDAYARDTMRLDPEYQAREAQLQTKLRNQGLSPGDRQWDSQMSSFNQARADDYERARLGSTAQGRDEIQGMFDRYSYGNERQNALRNQRIKEGIDNRQFNLSEAERLGKAGTNAAASESALALTK